MTAGNSTKQEDWVSGTSYASSTKTYNAYGMVATSTDRIGNATSYVYDANNLFVATTTNPLLQKTHFLYNYANGQVKWRSDPNSSLLKNIYDGLGRLKEVDVSSTSTPTTYATTTVYTYTDSTTTPSSIKRTDWLFPSKTVDTYQYFDGLNRIIQERKSSPTANSYFVTDRVYNSAGLLAQLSLPYPSTGASSTSATAISALYTTFTYDALHRVTSETNAVGTKTTSYSEWTTTATDPNGHIKDYVKDAFDNLATVVEHLITSNSTTAYSYDALNNLATTTDASGNVRHFTYDGLSRRLTAQDLHVTSDTLFGTWTYTYDDQGNITTLTDPKSQVVNRTYDALNRMLTEDYTGQAGTELKFVYDSCSNGIGYLCSASSTSATSTNAYDILGRVISATTTILGSKYNMKYSYDRQGNVTAWTYPNSSQATVSYNIAGLPSRVQRKASGGSLSDIVTSYDYAPTGQVLNALFGNNASTTYFYDPNTGYRLSSLQTNSDSTSIQNFAYTYDSAGNITGISNQNVGSTSESISYAYDALNRLTSASAPTASSSPYSHTYTYDALGNLLTFGTAQYSSIITTATTTPTILDTTPLTVHFTTGSGPSSYNGMYTVPSSGVNKVFVIMLQGEYGTSTVILNGDTVNVKKLPPEPTIRGRHYVGYLVGPTTGVLSVSPYREDFVAFTLQNADQFFPLDFNYDLVDNTGLVTSISNSIDTTQGDDAIFSMLEWGDTTGTLTWGAPASGIGEELGGSFGWSGSDAFGYMAGGLSEATETMSASWASGRTVDEATFAIKAASTNLISTTTGAIYTYGGTGYANPHAVTQVANGVSTSTFSYDQNGNLTQKTTDGLTTTYLWDYANRLTALGVSGAGTTTFGYDYTGQRVYKATASTTYLYPNKYFSIASSTGTGAKYATTTEYIWTPTGDTLISTVDQQFASGVATGTAKTLYYHPDHLGSTNVVTNASGTVVQTLDYYPYGGTRINSTSGNYSGAGRQYVNRFADQSSLDYLTSDLFWPGDTDGVALSCGGYWGRSPRWWRFRGRLVGRRSR